MKSAPEPKTRFTGNDIGKGGPIGPADLAVFFAGLAVAVGYVAVQLLMR